MQPTSRSRIAEITEALRTSNAAEVRLLLELVGLQVEDSRSKLVNASPEEFRALQGAAQVWDKLHKGLTVAPPNKEK